ncbi:MAG: hypothetical protein LBP30_08680 [Clostridiales Family XIII bacterium]|jgi:hypothetical protein|nr:hypothetical protein [Clostridiales Family XIII bacterium]
MNFDTFRKAVDSMEGYVGTVGVMGGEPTLHPEFERFAAYISAKFPMPPEDVNHFLRPQKEFMRANLDRELTHTIGYDSGLGKRQTLLGLGLWSSMGIPYKRHYEIIQDVFLYQAVNDHTNAMYHQPALITRKELGIGDAEWPELRDRCWIQNEWSATVTPKGAFFCEMAGALDMLFDGSGGWRIEPGWWKREPEEFGDQLHWCESCGIACHTFTRDAREETDDVSPSMYERLRAIDSPRLKKGRVRVIKIDNGEISDDSKASEKRYSETMPYTESYEARYNKEKSVLFPQGFVNIVICESERPAGDLEDIVFQNLKQFKKIYMLCSNGDAYRKLSRKFANVAVVALDGCGFGVGVNKILNEITGDEFIVLQSDEIRFSDKLCEDLGKLVINPGVLHYIDFSSPTRRDTKYIRNADALTKGFAAMMNKGALSLRKIGFDGVANAVAFNEIVKKWDQVKVMELSPEMEYAPPETTIGVGVRYAIYGTGSSGNIAVARIREAGAVFVCAVDSSQDKWGCDFHGEIVQSPKWLEEHKDSFDRVVIASVFYYAEIKKRLVEMGISSDRLTVLG